MAKGENKTRDGSHGLSQGNPCGHPAREGSADKRWRPAGGCAVQVDCCSAPGRVGVEKRLQRVNKALLKGERWGSDRSQV